MPLGWSPGRLKAFGPTCFMKGQSGRVVGQPLAEDAGPGTVSCWEAESSSLGNFQLQSHESTLATQLQGSWVTAVR